MKDIEIEKRLATIEANSKATREDIEDIKSDLGKINEIIIENGLLQKVSANTTWRRWSQRLYIAAGTILFSGLGLLIKQAFF